MKNLKLKSVFIISTLSIILNLNPIFAESNVSYTLKATVNTKSNLLLDVRSSPVWNSQNLIGKFENKTTISYNESSLVNDYVRVVGTDKKTGQMVEGWAFYKYLEKTNIPITTDSPTGANNENQNLNATPNINPTTKPIDSNTPEIYKKSINNIKANHPNWNFEFYDTKISLEKASNKQYNMNNPVPKIDIDSYKEKDINIINDRILLIKNLLGLKLSNEQIKNKYLIDNNFFLSTKNATTYFMNPVNFIDEVNIYQFLELKFDDQVYSKEIIKNILSDTYFAKNLDNYTNWFYKASKEYNLNPYFLISKAIVEGGASNKNSSSILLTGFSSGSKTYYNYFGINAIDGTSYNNAKDYAIKKDWSSPEKAILGGAEFISKNYIEKGQDTFYEFRYNLTGEDGYIKTKSFSHQYASNIADAYTKSKVFYKNFNDYISNSNLKFKIPVY